MNLDKNTSLLLNAQCIYAISTVSADKRKLFCLSAVPACTLSTVVAAWPINEYFYKPLYANLQLLRQI